jgi:hypothetical protein
LALTAVYVSIELPSCFAARLSLYEYLSKKREKPHRQGERKAHRADPPCPRSGCWIL